MIEVILPFLAVGLVVAGYYIGGFVRARAHVLVPMSDPVSLIILIGWLIPALVGLFDEEYLWIVTDLSYWAMLAAFMVGYVIGYAREQADVVYVGVHSITDPMEDVSWIIRYTAPDGRQCWQPQGFLEVCKTMILGIHNPLDLRAVQRYRHVTAKRPFFPMFEADVIDMADLRVEVSEVQKWRFSFKVESRKYVPSGNLTEPYYKWIVGALQMEEMASEYAELQTKAAEYQAALQTAQIKGGAAIITALSAKDPSQAYMDELSMDLDEIVSKYQRKVKRNAKEAEHAD